jgi:hypothetical protein
MTTGDKVVRRYCNREVYITHHELQGMNVLARSVPIGVAVEFPSHSRSSYISSAPWNIF